MRDRRFVGVYGFLIALKAIGSSVGTVLRTRPLNGLGVLVKTLHTYGKANPSEGSVSYQTNPSGPECLDSSVAGPEGFEPPTLPPTRLLVSFFRVTTSTPLSLLLYLAESPRQTLP